METYHRSPKNSIPSLRRRWTVLALLILLIAATFFFAVPRTFVANWLGSLNPFSHNYDVRPAPAAQDLAQYVNPFIGTQLMPDNPQLGPGFGGQDTGNVFPGADVPHGMVQWSPDTTNGPGGYRYNQSVIQGFSLSHFSGRGCPSYQDFPFIPTIGSIHSSPGTDLARYYSTFSHANEQASPGAYRVQLDNQVQVALTATPRSGFASFSYPPASIATLLINASGSANKNFSLGTGIKIDSPTSVSGEASSGYFCGRNNTYTLYFSATFDHPFTAFGTWNGAKLKRSGHTSSGTRSGAYLTFDTTNNSTIHVKVGLSFVSTANAALNAAQENPGWDFASISAAARKSWNACLNLIQIAGGSNAEKTNFYTALYHSFFHPNVFSDVNGQYLGFDQQVHTARGYVQYENFPGWDMYRSLAAFQAILEPNVVSDMYRSLLADALQGGGGLPRWQTANDNSGGMIGDSMDVVMATGYAFGVRNFDTQQALHAMDLGASDPTTTSGRNPTREGMLDYLQKGYVSTRHDQSASITLEYANDDFAISQFAQALGQTSLHAQYLSRSRNWQNLYNPASGYIQPRDSQGAFVEPFAPTTTRGFTEGDAAQYTWMIPFDFPGLFQRMGGASKARARLDTHFTELNGGANSPYAFMGNEPEFKAPWAYDFAGAPYRTQQLVREIQLDLFKPTPDGLSGNDDGGAMGSWYVFSALGLFPEIPGVAGFTVNSPLFSTSWVHLGNGHTLQINGQGAADNAPYLQSLALNGQEITNPWLSFASLQNGGVLQFQLGTQPNTTWGQQITLPKF